MFENFEDWLERLAPGLQPRKVPGMLYRKGGDAVDWATPGGYRYVPVALYWQAGAIEWVGAAALTDVVAYDFPRAYYGEPLLFVQVMACNPSTARITTIASSAGDAIEIHWRSDVAITSATFAWLAFGGQLRK